MAWLWEFLGERAGRSDKKAKQKTIKKA